MTNPSLDAVEHARGLHERGVELITGAVSDIGPMQALSVVHNILTLEVGGNELSDEDAMDIAYDALTGRLDKVLKSPTQHFTSSFILDGEYERPINEQWEMTWPSFRRPIDQDELRTE